jgi:hypothetical protein
MSTKDQALSSALHGEALLTAKRPELQPLIDHLREMAQGRDDIRAECAAVLAGAWFGDVGRRGHELIAAGLLMLAGPVDLDELDKWVRVGWERRRGGQCRIQDSEDQGPTVTLSRAKTVRGSQDSRRTSRRVVAV